MAIRLIWLWRGGCARAAAHTRRRMQRAVCAARRSCSRPADGWRWQSSGNGEVGLWVGLAVAGRRRSAGIRAAAVRRRRSVVGRRAAAVEERSGGGGQAAVMGAGIGRSGNNWASGGVTHLGVGRRCRVAVSRPPHRGGGRQRQYKHQHLKPRHTHTHTHKEHEARARAGAQSLTPVPLAARRRRTPTTTRLPAAL